MLSWTALTATGEWWKWFSFRFNFCLHTLQTDKAHDLQPDSYYLILGLCISGRLSIR